MTYFTFTTLSTIGFGDYHAWADEERLWTVLVFLCGINVISYLMGVFIEILTKF